MKNLSLLKEATEILMVGDPGRSKQYLRTILEDVNSPITKKYHEKLYDEVINKNHIDFDNIPDSKGDIKAYSGYDTMRSCLSIINTLAVDQKNPELVSYVKIINTALDNILLLKSLFKSGFSQKNEMIILEYNIHVYTCVQATTSILYYFVDYIKRPDQSVMSGTIKNTKYRPDLFYLQQLERFNSINASGTYKNYLSGILENGKQNFIGSSTIVGLGAITVVALSVVPLTRELIYQFYNTRRKVSDYLALQAYLIEMNKLYVEGNKNINSTKKASILKKQEKIKLQMMRLSDILKVDNANAREQSKRELKDKNSLLNIDNIQKEINNSPLQLL